MINLYGNELDHGNTISNCCGSRYKKSIPKRHTNQVGIIVWEGAQFKERSSPKMEIKHVYTKNGILTISVRKQY